MKAVYFVIFNLMTLVGLNACAGTDSTSHQGASNNSYHLVPKQEALMENWFLTKLNGRSYEGARITLNISSKKRVSGFSGCNRYFSSIVEVNGNQLKLSSIGSTRMLCREPNGSQVEHQYLTALRGVTHFTKVNNRLVLEGPSGKLIFYKKSKR